MGIQFLASAHSVAPPSRGRRQACLCSLHQPTLQATPVGLSPVSLSCGGPFDRRRFAGPSSSGTGAGVGVLGAAAGGVSGAGAGVAATASLASSAIISDCDFSNKVSSHFDFCSRACCAWRSICINLEQKQWNCRSGGGGGGAATKPNPGPNLVA